MLMQHEMGIAFDGEGFAFSLPDEFRARGKRGPCLQLAQTLLRVVGNADFVTAMIAADHIDECSGHLFDASKVFLRGYLYAKGARVSIIFAKYLFPLSG